MRSALYILVLAIFTIASSDVRADLYEAKTRYVIAKRTFDIPNAYLEEYAPRSEVRDSAVLQYVLPELESKRQYTKAERLKLIRAGRTGGMLLEDASIRPEFEVIIENFKRRDQIKNYEGEFYGLKKYTAPKPGPKALKPDDTFLEISKDGKISSFLFCSPPGEDVVPGCRHKFRDKGVLYEIYYSIGKLPKWREQHQAAIKFIDGFESKGEMNHGTDQHRNN